MSKLKRIGIGFLALLGGATALSQTVACMPGLNVVKPEYCVAATVANAVLTKVNENIAPDSSIRAGARDETVVAPDSTEGMDHPQ